MSRASLATARRAAQQRVEGAKDNFNCGGSLLPAGVTYGLDGEGRPESATASSSALVTAASYSPLGLASITYASGDSHTDTDSYSYSASTGRMSGYSFTVDGATDAGAYTWLANGELSGFSISDGVSGTADNGFACTYSHDDMGRLSAANCGASSNQTYTFDPFGNVCKTAVAGTNFCPSYNLYNQVASVSYDSDGDPLSDPVSGFTNVYNAEGRATTFDNVAVTYDALNRAVEAGDQEFIYGPSGTKIAVMNGQTLVRADIPLVGGAEAIYNSSGFVAYRHTDLLGSSRLATNYNGGLYSETALAPYGEPLLETGTHDRSFTGAKQDIANGTAPSSDANGDYDFLAREYSPTQSRWWTPDPAGLAAVDPDDPQSWNRYSYVSNLPLDETDAYGCFGCPPGSHPATKADAKKYIATAESYLGQSLKHSDSPTSHYGPGAIDCSGLVMCSLAGQEETKPLTKILSYLGIDLATGNIDRWSVPGTGEVGDVVYFNRPGHIAFVTHSESNGVGFMLGSQSRSGPAGKVAFGPLAPWWGNAKHTSAAVFRRPCIKNLPQPAQSAAGGPGSAAASGYPPNNPFGGVDSGPIVSEKCEWGRGGKRDYCKVYVNE